MGLKLLIFTLLFLLFGTGSVLAASVEAPAMTQSEIQIDQAFSISSNLTGVQSGEIYFVKCRIGPSLSDPAASPSSPNEGQTYNPATANWFFDTDAWTEMPTVTATGSTINFSIQCKIKSSATEGQKIIYTRACLKKSDGTCGTSFQSVSGTAFAAIAPASTPTPSPTPTTNPSLNPTPSPTSSNSTASFTISNIPSQINSDQSFSAKVTLSMPNSTNTDYYLTGAFKKPDGTRYLGLTKKNSEWIEYGKDYSNQNKITTDASGNWTGNLEVKPDTNDSDYKGSGDYIFRVGRYTASGSGPTWSNETTIKINDVNNTADNSPTPKPTIKTSSANSPVPASTKNTTNSPQPRSYDTLVYHSATIAGVTTSADPVSEVKTKNQKQTNPIIWLGLIFIFAGFGLIVYIYFIKNAKIRKVRI